MELVSGKALFRSTTAGVVLITSLILAVAARADAPGGGPFDALPDARPGECFARVMIPARYETRYKDVLVDQGEEHIGVHDARFASQTRDILIRDAAKRYEVHQPVYKAVQERVMVRPAYERLMVEGAIYRHVKEQVQVAPAHTAWKPGKSLADWSGVKDTKNQHGEVYCLVEIPAKTKTVTKRILVRPARTHTVTVPPLYRTITRHILVDPGGVEEVPMAAQYDQITTQNLVAPASAYRTTIAPRTQQISYRVEIAPAQYDWIPVLCKTNATPAAIAGLQSQLQQLGYYHDRPSGELDLPTKKAVRAYQQAADIPHDGYLSLETLLALKRGQTIAEPQTAHTEPLAKTQAESRAEAHAYAQAEATIMPEVFYPNAEILLPMVDERVSHITPVRASAPRHHLRWPGK
ncbi:MAG: peptidoglycan-binding domain-containing protein [Robiginitomaculum sp.]|nr:peptidoglycan-binding domain-containing protein [Robiginitomaculum sp.]MDQ7076404.1 peptidoglycan-binding domain-containing protein [Robiginitomaculum sp.]